MEILNSSLGRHFKAVHGLFPKIEATDVFDVRGLKSYDSLARCGSHPCLVVGTPGEFQPEDGERLYGFCKSSKLRSLIVIREFKANASRDNSLIQFFSLPGLIAKESAIIHQAGDAFPFLYIKCNVGDNSDTLIRSDFEIKCKLAGFVPMAIEYQSSLEVTITASDSLPVPSFSELKLICTQLSDLIACSGEKYFLGSLCEISEVNSDTLDLVSSNTFAYQNSSGFCKCDPGLSPGFILECVSRKLDPIYGLEWAKAFHSKYCSSMGLNSRQVRLIVVNCPSQGDQALTGAFFTLKEMVSQELRKSSEKLNRFEIYTTPGQQILEMYAQLFRRCAELECESQAQPPRILSRAFKFIVKWESEYFESAGKFIDGIIQLHSLVAASIARAYLDPSVGGVITGMFDKRPHTELGNWMDEFRAAKAAFDNQIQLFAKGRSFNIAGRIPPLLLPSIGRLYDTSVHDILDELQKTRNRKFAHAGTLSDQEKEAVMLATKENVLRYLRLTSPFWSCLDLAMVCAVKPSSDLNGKGCNLELKCVCSDDHVVKSFFCPGGDAGEFKEGTIVVVSFEMSFGPVPLLPLYFLKKRSVPDSEHIYFLSNKAKDGNYFEFNSYTGAPEGIL
jgi:hypothetical protein